MKGKNNNRGIFYGTLGVATLVIAIVGATFAYFTASASNNNVIKGNMATVQLSLAVEKVVKVDETKQGMIPMSNGMVEEAVNNDNEVCVDDNGNAVCQIYKITLTNDSSAGQFVDGYVSLRYGSGTPTDYTGTWKDEAKFVNETKVADKTTGVGTTMRWAQVFPGDGTTVTNKAASGDYSTAGEQILGTDSEKIALSHISADKADSEDDADEVAAKAHNRANIRNIYGLISTPDGNGGTTVNSQAVLAPVTIAGSSYNVIGTNYIRISNHNWTADATGKQSYKRADDVTSALVFNHSVAAGKSVSYYIVVWLSETGTNQTAGAIAGTNPAALNFFDGNVTFISAQGSEVSATFAGYARVSSQV